MPALRLYCFLCMAKQQQTFLSYSWTVQCIIAQEVSASVMCMFCARVWVCVCISLQSVCVLSSQLSLSSHTLSASAKPQPPVPISTKMLLCRLILGMALLEKTAKNCSNILGHRHQISRMCFVNSMLFYFEHLSFL